MNGIHSITRREFNQSMLLAILGAISPIGCSSNNNNLSYQELITSTWRHTDKDTDKGSVALRELVRYATLAANSHNTQPWRFKLETDQITVFPDFSRRCSAVDPDNHHLFISLGCATENLVLAAKAHGLHAHVELTGLSDEAIRIGLEPSSSGDSVLFQAIPERQCTRALYNGKLVSTEQLAEIEAVSQGEGVSVQVFTNHQQMNAILDYVIAGNSAQMNDDAFLKELKRWIRFNESAVVEHRDGLFAASSGNPTMPNWLGNLVLTFAFTERGENDKYRDHIRSSAGIIAFVSEQNDKASWIRVGRSYQRFALQTTALGIRHAHINQAVEVPEVRAQFAQYLGIGDRRPDLLVRFGYGPLMPRSARRPVDQVLI